MKKVSLLLIIISVVICGANLTRYEASDTKKAVSAKYHENAVKSQEVYDDILTEYQKSNYPNDYAGAYVDEEGILNLCTTSSINTKRMIDGTKYVTKKYSYNYLKNIDNILFEKMSDFNIQKIAVNFKNNCVFVEVHENKRQEIIEYLEAEVAYFEGKAVCFQDVTKVTNTKKAYAATMTYYNYFWFLRSEGTISFSAYHTATNRYGIVTNGHVAPLNQEMRDQDGAVIGTTFKSSIYGTVDAAFVPFDNTKGTTWENKTVGLHYNGYYHPIVSHNHNTNYLEGTLILKFGQKTTATTGLIINSSATITVDGKTLWDVVETGAHCDQGDSGSPVVVYDRYYNYLLLGAVFAKNNDLDHAYFCKIENILIRLVVTPVTQETLPTLP